MLPYPALGTFEHQSACPNTAARRDRTHQLRTEPRAWNISNRAAHEHCSAQLRTAFRKIASTKGEGVGVFAQQEFCSLWASGRVYLKFILMADIKRSNSRFSSHCTAKLYSTWAEVARAQSCANHVQHIESLSRAACRVPRNTDRSAQLLSLAEIEFSFTLFLVKLYKISNCAFQYYGSGSILNGPLFECKCCSSRQPYFQ